MACAAREGPMIGAVAATCLAPLLLVEAVLVRVLLSRPLFEDGTTGAAGAACGGGGRLQSLEGVRALAALHIAAFHIWQQWNGYSCDFCGFGKYAAVACPGGLSLTESVAGADTGSSARSCSATQRYFS